MLFTVVLEVRKIETRGTKRNKVKLGCAAAGRMDTNPKYFQMELPIEKSYWKPFEKRKTSRKLRTRANAWMWTAGLLVLRVQAQNTLERVKCLERAAQSRLETKIAKGGRRGQMERRGRCVGHRARAHK
jgi:hypothetical protein